MTNDVRTNNMRCASECITRQVNEELLVSTLLLILLDEAIELKVEVRVAKVKEKVFRR